MSTIESALLLVGMLTAARYFDQESEDQREIRTLADALYCRADWQWARNGGALFVHQYSHLWIDVRGIQDAFMRDKGIDYFENNLSFQQESPGKRGWTSQYHYGINLGPVVLMRKNHRLGLIWRMTRACPYLFSGLRRAEFVNRWL